jgi:hypothetical protein
LIGAGGEYAKETKNPPPERQRWVFKSLLPALPEPPPTANGVHNDAVAQSHCAIERNRALA